MNETEREIRLSNLVTVMNREVVERVQIVPKAREHIKNVVRVFSELVTMFNKSLERDAYKLIVRETRNSIVVVVTTVSNGVLVDRDGVRIDWFDDPLTLQAFKANSEHALLFTALARISQDASIGWQPEESDSLHDAEELGLLVLEELIPTFGSQS
jgi:hypothetical protein